MAVITLPQEWVNYAGFALSATAGAAINEPYAAVKLGSNPGEVIQSSDSVGVIGFIKYETGKTFAVAGSVAQVPINTLVQVHYSGSIVWAVSGAAITAGVKVMGTAGGQVIAHTTGLAYAGVALTGAGAQHELVAVLVSIGTAI